MATAKELMGKTLACHATYQGLAKATPKLAHSSVKLGSRLLSRYGVSITWLLATGTPASTICATASTFRLVNPTYGHTSSSTTCAYINTSE